MWSSILLRRNIFGCLKGIYKNFSSNSNNLLHGDISLNNIKIRAYLEDLQTEFYNLRVKSSSNDSDIRRIQKLSSIVSAFEQRITLEKNIASLKEIESEDKDMKELVEEEKEVYSNLLRNLDSKLTENLLATCDDVEEYSSAFFEINAGVGGQEAMLFARELLDMYLNFIDHKGWEIEILHTDYTDLKGLRHATLLIYSENAYPLLKYEAGVHRVQRVPATEKSGRMHTSTVSVSVVPRPHDIETVLNDKDLRIETKRASGAGGQHVNTTDSAVRIIHIPTGVTVECQTERSQLKNREIALKKLQSKLFQSQMDAQEANKAAIKKSQVGTSNRNEKIRTYNFTQDRITDHRIKGGTVHNMQNFLQGGTMLEDFIKEISLQKRKEQFLELLNWNEIKAEN